MKFLNTPHERKSALLTAIIAVLLLLIFSLLGLSYFDPPIRYGIEVNFGTSSQGSGKVQPKELVAPPPLQATKASSSPPIEKAETKVLTQKEASIPVVKKEIKTPPKKVSPKKEIPKREVNKPVEKKTPPAPPKPKVDASTKNILSKMLTIKKVEAKNDQGEGDDRVKGDKGKREGNPYASSYYSKAGLGGNGAGYGLNGRSLQSNGAVTQECNEEGTVVVRITVDQQGNVIEAEAGVKGSTNVHPCLLTPARKTALLHKWFPDSNAPSRQVGFVVVIFKLSE